MPAKKKKSAPKKAAPKKAAKKATTTKPKASAKTATKATKASAKKPGPRADFGKPIDELLAKKPESLRAIVESLRALIQEAAPEATAQLKWGHPFFSVGNAMMCVVQAHKAHVNLVLPGKGGDFDDPDGLLENMGTTGKHLRLTSTADIPTERVRVWMKQAASMARGG